MSSRRIRLLTALLSGAFSCGCSAAQPASSVATGSPSAPQSNRAPGGTAAPAMPGKNVPAIKVDTVGYPTRWRKIAIFNVEPKAPVVKNEKGEVVLSINADRVQARGVDEASKDQVWQVDFSELERPGRYTIESGATKSDPFRIGDGLYLNALKAGLKHFYLQRCRTPLSEPHASWEGTSFVRAAKCHAHEQIGWDLNDHPKKLRKWKVEAGWHDAGNFEMYVPSTAPTAQALLMAYEAHPELFSDGDLNLPESGNKIPDILDEAKWGLDWVLSMQEPSGAFRHREAVTDWSDEGPADKERKPHWIAGIGTASTAKAAAVLALAARIYKPHNPAFSRQCERASRAAWAFLEKHPERILVDGKGSEQPLWDDGPEFDNVTGAWLIAAAEVWRTFRIPSALEKAKGLFKDKMTQPDQLITGAWANLSRWGLASLALDPETPREVRELAKTRILEAVELLHERVEKSDGYRCASGPKDYYWGHNSNLLEKAHLMAVAQRLDANRPWLTEAVRDQWHWVLGRNPNGYSMVTRIGKGPDRMYHMEWGKAEPPAPGYLIGGPNAQEGKFLSPDAPAKALLWDNPMPMRTGLKAHSLWHATQSDLWDGGFAPEEDWKNGWWAVVEPDIIYNANLVLVAVEMQK